MGLQEKSFKFNRAATPVLLKLGTQTRRVFRFSYCGESISLVSNFSQSPENITSGQSVITNGSRIMNGKHPSVSGAVGARWQYRTIISNASHGVFILLLRSVHRMMSFKFCPDVPDFVWVLVFAFCLIDYDDILTQNRHVPRIDTLLISEWYGFVVERKDVYLADSGKRHGWKGCWGRIKFVGSLSPGMRSTGTEETIWDRTR